MIDYDGTFIAEVSWVLMGLTRVKPCLALFCMNSRLGHDFVV
jgi:hypothetical protein